MTTRFSNFSDLAEHYAREVQTPDYARAFMEQTELSRLSVADEPSSAEMPDPDVAQAAIEMMLATVFDLFRDTRMEDFASEVAWGIANSFHVVAKRLDDREDAMAKKLQEKMARRPTSTINFCPRMTANTRATSINGTARKMSVRRIMISSVQPPR